MKYLLIGLFVFVLFSVGCSGPSIPTAEEAPYKITWTKDGGYSDSVYCDNYELGSSVVVNGYWEHRPLVFPGPGYYYEDELLILDANEVRIERRRKY